MSSIWHMHNILFLVYITKDTGLLVVN